MTSVAIYGAGQLGTNVASMLRDRGHYEVLGPFGRNAADSALDSGADVVIIATTSRFRDVASDIVRAIEAGSNVLVSAEECANPWLVDPELADAIDMRARQMGVTVLGAGLNPGLIFDALVLTLLGAIPRGCDIEVARVVDIGKFGPAVLARLGVGVGESEFRQGVANGEILGHAGFPQSMSIVARGLGITIDTITEQIDPIIAETAVKLVSGQIIDAGRSVGVRQTYRAFVHGNPWFTAVFDGHVQPDLLGWTPSDTIVIRRDGVVERTVAIEPGLPSQSGSQSMIANSVDRVIEAAPGWLTVADVPPAAHRGIRSPSGSTQYPG